MDCLEDCIFATTAYLKVYHEEFILQAISKNCYFWNMKMRLTEGSLKECAGSLSAGLGKKQAVWEVGTEVLSHCSV